MTHKCLVVVHKEYIIFWYTEQFKYDVNRRQMRIQNQAKYLR